MLSLLKPENYQLLSKISQKPIAKTIDGDALLFINGETWRIQDIMQILFEIESSVHNIKLKDPTMASVFQYIHNILPLEYGIDDKDQILSINQINDKIVPSEAFVDWLKKELDYEYLTR